MSDLGTYFDEHKGVGVLSTVNAEGVVNSAIYGRPHLQEDGTLAFIMAERLTLANLQQNPHACYLFKEEDGWKGKRFHLTMLREEQDPEKILAMRRKPYTEEQEKKVGRKHIGYFRIDEELPLLGAGPLVVDDD